MKSVVIRPKKEGFSVNFYETKDNREDFEKEPHYLGFYHYPDNIKDSTAFNRLKKVMIEEKENQITLLKEEIKYLKGMKYHENH